MDTPDFEIGSPFVVRSASRIGTAYAAGTAFSMAHHNAIGLQVAYQQGSESSITFKVEVSNDGGVSYGQQVAESTTGGTITVSLAERTISASGTAAILISPVRAGLVRISSYSNYATVATGTVAIKAWPLWVG